MENQVVQPDRKDLKIQALLEKITSITTQYENQLADYRVEMTMLSNELQEVRARLSERDSGPEAPSDDVSPE